MAEIKYNNPKEQAKFREYIRAQDKKSLHEMIYYADVVEQVMERVKYKTLCYTAEIRQNEPLQQSRGTDERDRMITAVCRLYKEIMIPLTMEIETEYLAQRPIGDGDAGGEY